MLNFLEQKNKKQIISEYLKRVAVYLLSFSSLTFLVLILLFTPSFFFAKYKNDTVKAQLESLNKKILNQSDDAIALVKNVNQLTGVFSLNINSALLHTQIIDKIVSLKNNNIKILSVNITNENASFDRKIILNGLANTRDSLSIFEKNIISDGTFSSIVFPVSNFIKSTDLDFSVTLTYKNK